MIGCNDPLVFYDQYTGAVHVLMILVCRQMPSARLSRKSTRIQRVRVLQSVPSYLKRNSACQTACARAGCYTSKTMMGHIF